MNRAELVFPQEPSRFDREDFHRLLRHAKAISASDIHIKSMTRIMCRVHGRMVPITHRRLEDAEVATILTVMYGAANAELEVRTGKPLDNAYRHVVDRETALRFRWNAHACEVAGAFGVKITLRELPAKPPRLPKEELGEAVVKALFPDDGLILVCGATGSGKSTLLAGVISEKAEEPDADCNIITLESPIEFTYDKVITESCMITQTAIPQNLPTFAKGVENALREDPDIIVVGEARDAATIEAAVLAAQTGHAVYTTVHSNSVGTTFLRLMQSLPVEKADSILGSLIDSMRLIICQRLYPSTDGRRVAVRETLVFDRNIRRELLLTATRNISELPAVADDLVRRYGQTTLGHAEQLVAAGRLDPMYVDVLHADEQFGRQQREQSTVAMPASVEAPVAAADRSDPAVSPHEDMQQQRMQAMESELSAADAAITRLKRELKQQTRRAEEAEHARNNSERLQLEQKERVEIGETITVADLASRLALKRGDVVKTLFKMGVMATITQSIDHDTAVLVTEKLGYEVIRSTGDADSDEEPAGVPEAEEVSSQETVAVPADVPSEASAAAAVEVADSPAAVAIDGQREDAQMPSESPAEEVVVSQEPSRTSVPRASTRRPFGRRVMPDVPGPVFVPVPAAALEELEPEEGTPGQSANSNDIESHHIELHDVISCDSADVPGGGAEDVLVPIPQEASAAKAEEASSLVPEASESEVVAQDVSDSDGGHPGMTGTEGASVDESVLRSPHRFVELDDVAVAEPVEVIEPPSDGSPRRASATVTVLASVAGEPQVLTERRELLGELCDALLSRLEEGSVERAQVQMAADFVKAISVAGLPQHMWQHVWSRLKQHLESTSELLALRLAGEAVFFKQNESGTGGDTARGGSEREWALVRRARTLVEEPVFMPRLSDATT